MKIGVLWLIGVCLTMFSVEMEGVATQRVIATAGVMEAVPTKMAPDFSLGNATTRFISSPFFLRSSLLRLLAQAYLAIERFDRVLAIPD